MSPVRDVGIISTGHDVADARIHKITAALVRRGLDVEVRGLGDRDAGPAGADVIAVSRSSLIGRASRSLVIPWLSRARVLVTVDPDVVPMAVVASRIRRRRVVVDVHEDYARLLADRPWATGGVGQLARTMVRLSTWLAARADLTVVTDTHIPPHTAKRRLIVENLPDVQLLDPGSPDPQPRAIYIGDLRTSRGLFDMVDAVARAPGWRLDLVGPVAEADRAALNDRLQDLSLSGRVVLHGRLPPKQAWKIAKGAWVGLALLHETPAFREAMPTKVYEYLASGLPVISSRLPRQAALLEQSGGGVLVDTPADAAALLRGWSDKPDAIETYRDAAREWAATSLSARTPYDDFADAVAELLSR